MLTPGTISSMRYERPPSSKEQITLGTGILVCARTKAMAAASLRMCAATSYAGGMRQPSRARIAHSASVRLRLMKRLTPS